MKLAITFLGPYKITEVVGNDRYEVERIGEGDGPEKTSCSADHLKPWRGFADDLDGDMDFEDDMADDDSEEED